MGTTRGSVEHYTCFNDCRQEGCPGHTLRVCYHRTSDVFFVEVDGEEVMWFDPNQLEAAKKSWGSVE